MLLITQPLVVFVVVFVEWLISIYCERFGLLLKRILLYAKKCGSGAEGVKLLFDTFKRLVHVTVAL